MARTPCRPTPLPLSALPSGRGVAHAAASPLLRVGANALQLGGLARLAVPASICTTGRSGSRGELARKGPAVSTDSLCRPGPPSAVHEPMLCYAHAVSSPGCANAGMHKPPGAGCVQAPPLRPVSGLRLLLVCCWSRKLSRTQRRTAEQTCEMHSAICRPAPLCLGCRWLCGLLRLVMQWHVDHAMARRPCNGTSTMQWLVDHAMARRPCNGTSTMSIGRPPRPE